MGKILFLKTTYPHLLNEYIEFIPYLALYIWYLKMKHKIKKKTLFVIYILFFICKKLQNIAIF